MYRGSRKHVLDWVERPMFLPELLALARPAMVRLTPASIYMPLELRRTPRGTPGTIRPKVSARAFRVERTAAMVAGASQGRQYPELGHCSRLRGKWPVGFDPGRGQGKRTGTQRSGKILGPECLGEQQEESRKDCKGDRGSAGGLRAAGLSYRGRPK